MIPKKPAPAKAGGAPWLKTTLVQCAWAASRKKASYLQAQFHRLRAGRGAKKAIGALAASMRGNLFVDGRNFLDPERARAAGLVYEGVGRPSRNGEPIPAGVE